MKKLTPEDISEDYKNKVYVQDYGKKSIIQDVQIININNFVVEDGDFSELIRLNENGELEQFPGYKLAQVNRTKLFCNAIKGWHIHYNQEDVWFVFPDSQVLVGLWDLRENSPTKNQTMRLTLGGGKSQLVYIPRGVAHGVANLGNKTADMIYFINQKFDMTNPDENRLPWDSLGADFWTFTKD